MKTIFVLAQHPELAEAVRAVLNIEQYRVVHRIDLESAEPFLQPGAIDICVVDVELGEVQGLWAIEKIRRRVPACPILVYTAPGAWEWEEDAYVQGVSHILAKPVRPRALVALLDRLSSKGTPPPAIRVAPVRPTGAIAPRVAEFGRSQVAALEVLRDFSAVLSHSLCAEAMLKQFLLLLREILGVNRAAIFLGPPTSGFNAKGATPEGRLFHSACAIGLSQGLLQNFALTLESGLGAFLHRQGRIVRRDGDEALHDPDIQMEFELLGVQVAIPILDREALIGIAVFDGRVTGESLGNTELELVFHLLEQLGLAVRNIWLHDQSTANHAMLADILRQLSSACVVVGRDLTVLHHNRTAQRYFGKAARNKGELEFNDLPPLLASKVFQVLKTGTAIATFKYHPPDAPHESYHVSIVPFEGRSAFLPNSALLVVEDHTQAEQLQRLEVETANLRLVKIMADRLAHEIGNAMVPLSTHQQLLAERYKDPEFRSSLTGALAEGVKRVTRLVNQMRFLARDAVEPREAFPLGPLIEEAYLEAQKHHTVKAARLVFDPGTPPPVLTGDRAALKHAFAEVLLNALQANPSDAKITVRVNPDVASSTANGSGRTNGQNHPTAGHALQIEIQDNGAGFSPEALAKAPEPFFTTRNVGLGLGMTVSRRIIETHHGELSILNPKAGQAGIVRISLPMDTTPSGEHSASGVS